MWLSLHEIRGGGRWIPVHPALACLVLMVVSTPLLLALDAPSASPETRALRFLAREVPLWSTENHCFSCHNNGDAARALYDAHRRAQGLKPANDALVETTRWLRRPETWDKNGGDGPFNDKLLARIVFASTQVAARDAGLLTDRAPLERAAERLVKDQTEAGFWSIEEGQGSLGSPAGYGRPLATLTARDVLRAVDPERYRAEIARAETWLFARPVVSTIDAAIALRLDIDLPARRRVLDRLRAAQAPDGGFGPFADTPTEPFDTALVILALTHRKPTEETRPIIERARRYLIAEQDAAGSWRETTRPSGAESYAQRLSTSGWATLALLASGNFGK